MHSKQSIGRRGEHWRFTTSGCGAGSCIVGCMAQLSLACPASQCDTFLVGIPFVVCKHGNNECTAAAAKYMPCFKRLSLHLPLFSSLPHPHILFAHHNTSPCLPAASLISSCHYYSCIALFSAPPVALLRRRPPLADLNPASSSPFTLRPAQ